MKLKNILAGALFLLTGTFANAQNGLENIIVEKYYVTNAADANNANTALTGAGYATGTLPVGSIAWRVYADLLPGWGVQSVYGVPGHPLVLTSSTSFFNHPNANTTGGNFSSNSVSILGDGTTLLDSYLSCGAVAPGRFGVLKAEDNSAAVPAGGGANYTITPGTVLANNDPSAAPALTTADGIYNVGGTPSLLALTLLGDAAAAPVNIFTDGSTVGGSYNSTNTSWGVLGEQIGAFPTGTNRVLIGQFTTDGVFQYALNVQIRNNTTFAVQNYVNSNPVGAEILMTALAGTLNQPNPAPSVSITAPANGASFFVGDIVNITANATDVAPGTVSQVEFFVNGVSVGVDNSSPYSATYTATSGSKNITAVATDNGGATATSSIVTITVGTNTPPLVSITAPANGTLVIGGNAVQIDALASDPGGSVSQVEFFVNGVSVGVDLTSPYSVSWTSGAPFGTRLLTAVATDNFNATTTSATVSINVQNPAALPYTIGNLTEKCVNSTFCLPVTAIDPVSDVIGYDIVLDYDVTKVAPTGAIVRSNDLLLPSFNYNMVSTAYSNDATNGKLRIAVYFNGSAPSNARFAGTGDIICVEFAKTGLGNADNAVFSADTLMESRITGVQLKATDAGTYTTYKDSLFSSNLKFWEDFSPIRYNAAVPADYLITNIYGNNNSCNNRSVAAVQPDVNGLFTYNINNGTKLEIIKDIAAATDVQPVVNGFDAFLTRRVLINDASFVPSVYQMVAMDVNTDGVVSAGDLSQINQRAVLFIPEFQQDWNYNAQGVSNGQPSRDWLFVDVNTVSASPSYYISTTYPSNDGIGYSKNKVPQVDFCSPVPVSLINGDCPVIGTESYIGVLLGDANGNYSSNNGAPSPFRAAGSGKVTFDLTKLVIADGFVNIPVSIKSFENVNAVDFSFRFNSSKLSFDNVSDLTGKMLVLSHLNAGDQTVRFTSSSLENIEKNASILNLRFAINGSDFNAGDLNAIAAYINGESAQVEVRTERITASKVEVSVYPNPANNTLNVFVSEDAHVELTDMSGRVIASVNNVLADEKQEISVAGVADGVYMLKVWNGAFVSTSKVVVKH